MSDDSLRPSPEAFLDLSTVNPLTDGRGRLSAMAVCDDAGRPAHTFLQGQTAHFFYEFEILDEIGFPMLGLEFRDGTGRVIHGKSSIQFALPTHAPARPGMFLRCHLAIDLQVKTGEYSFSVGLASTDEASYLGYLEGPLSHVEFSNLVEQHCRAMDVSSFVVEFAPRGKLLHHGEANLPGQCHVLVAKTSMKPASPFAETRRAAPARTSQPHDGTGPMPTIFHVTHWKAGSQWVHKILRECTPGLLVPPQLDEAQFHHWPLQPGKIYPTVYVTNEAFDEVRLPRDWRRFVIIRDLRDTLVSGYFSAKLSHPILDPRNARWRKTLNLLPLDAGLIYLMSVWLPMSARIQRSWAEAGEPIIRYEDLLDHDLEILERVLVEECQLPVSRKRFREVVVASRFESITRGRMRGDEDVSVHERKGIAGDWRNYFTDGVKQAFKDCYGDLLILTGYERDLNW